MKTETIVCRFIGDFKVGDNLVYNAHVLCQLVEAGEGASFNKLIVLQAGSIIEASLDQVIYRAQNFNQEGVPNIAEEDRKEIEGKNLERFTAILGVMKKYKILDQLGDDIYAQLDRLRRYRNKIHIQLDIGIEGVSRNEPAAFSDEIRDWALRTNVRVLEHLNDRFARPKSLEKFAHKLTVPSP